MVLSLKHALFSHETVHYALVKHLIVSFKSFVVLYSVLKIPTIAVRPVWRRIWFGWRRPDCFLWIFWLMILELKLTNFSLTFYLSKHFESTWVLKQVLNSLENDISFVLLSLCLQCRLFECLFQRLQLVEPVVMANFLDSTVFMSKQASLAVEAVAFLMEWLTSLRLVLFVLWFLADHFSCSMSELALHSVTTEAELDPVLAHFGLVLCLVHFARSARLIGLALKVWKIRVRDGGLCCANCATIVGIKRLGRTKRGLELHSVFGGMNSCWWVIRYILEGLSNWTLRLSFRLVKGISLNSHRCLSFASQFKFDLINEVSVFIDEELSLFQYFYSFH